VGGRWAREIVGLRRVVAFVRPENHGSARGATKWYSWSTLVTKLAVASVISMVALLCARHARAADEREARPPMPEPIFTETVTDLDGAEVGEVEVEANASELRARRGSQAVLSSSIEAEWLATRRLGLRLEPTFLRSNVGEAESRNRFGGGGAASWKLLQDFRHDFHVQVETGAHFPFDASVVSEAGESALPWYADVRAGVRLDRWTIRGGVGVGAGGHPEHVPLRGSLALLTGLGPTERFGFIGVEVDADGARRDPIVVALNLVADCTPVGLPLRVAFAVPVVVGAPSNVPSLGAYVRLFFVTDREVAYGRTGVAR
jgi:hypothetical protein